MRVGFIGLGHLGKTIAKRLIGQGVDLVVWNRTKEKAQDLGVPVAESPAKLADAADAGVIFLNLFDSDAVAAVLDGKDGLLKGDCRDKIILDTTTNHFDRVPAFYAAAREHGARYLETPVLGSVVPASTGSLTVLVSGDNDAYLQARPLLEKIGKSIFYLGEEKLATQMKLVNNMVLGTLMATGAEAVAMGEAAGLDRATVVDIILSGAGNSAVLNGKKGMLTDGSFPTQFSSALIYKDLHYLQDLAKALKRPLFTGSAVKEVYAMAFAEGIENEDFAAVYRIFKNF